MHSRYLGMTTIQGHDNTPAWQHPCLEHCVQNHALIEYGSRGWTYMYKPASSQWKSMYTATYKIDNWAVFFLQVSHIWRLVMCKTRLSPKVVLKVHTNEARIWIDIPCKWPSLEVMTKLEGIPPPTKFERGTLDIGGDPQPLISLSWEIPYRQTTEFYIQARHDSQRQ